MSNSIFRLGSILLVAWLYLGSLPAQGLDLESEIRSAGQNGKEWLVYSIEPVDDRHFACCHTWTGGTVRPVACRPEDRGDSWITRDDLPPSKRAMIRVFVGIEDGRVVRLGAYSSGCQVETTWPLKELHAVRPSQSLGVLRRLALGDRALAHSTHGTPRQLRDQTLATIAKHRASEAAPALVDLATPDRGRDLRQQAIFWLSQTGGPLAEKTLLAAVHNDPSSGVREHAVFALSQLPDGRGVELLLGLLRTAKDGKTLRQALFWLAESDDPRALETISKLLQ